MSDDPRGFGRIVRGPQGNVEAIVEEYVATPEQLNIRELNVGAYCFRSEWLWEALPRIQKNPQKGEYYLTDVVELAVKDHLAVQAVVHDDLIETIGINTRVHLAEAEAAMRQRINRAHMLNGVSMTDPASTYIEAGVTIGKDTVIMPNTYIHGKTVIGEGNILGPNTIIRDSKIGNRCKVLASVMEGAVLEDDIDMGPFARLRKGAHLGNHVHMGNFGEVKDSYLAPGVKVGHFSYHWECHHRREHEYRRRDDHLQLRRREEESNRDRLGCFHRLRHHACGSAEDRRRREDRCGSRGDEGCSRRYPGGGRAGARH